MTAWTPWSPGRGDVVSVKTAGGRRPAFVVSPAAYSARTGFALLCPIAAQARGYPFEVAGPRGLLEPGEVIVADRVSSLNVRSSGMRLVCALPEETVVSVLEKLATLTSLPSE